MASMAIRTSDLTRFSMYTFLKFLFRNSRSQGMLFDKYRIGMTAITGLVDVGNVCHGFVILARKNIMFSVTVITIGRPFCPLHDHLGMETLQILLLRLLMASGTIHLFVRRLLPALSVFIILNPSMAIRTG